MKKLLIFALITITSGLAAVATGKDTDVYLLPPSGLTRDDAPNVLIILDTSGSMDTDVTTGRAAYVPATDYCATYAADAGDCFDSDKIYWSRNGTAPTNNGTDNYFLATYNVCNASVSPLSGTAGKYTDQIAYWNDSENPDKWRRLSDNKHDKTVECKTDGGSHGTAAGDGE